jgi:phosphate acetyltransferase
MDVMESIYERARKANKKLAFPEATEEKILQAVRQAADTGICRPVLVGDVEAIEAAAAQFAVSLGDIEVLDGVSEGLIIDYAERYVKANPALTTKTMIRRSKDPLYVALMMLQLGEVDGVFAGMSHSTGDIIASAQLVVGLQEGVELISSFGIHDTNDFDAPEGHYIAFGDCAVAAAPTPGELAGIAIATCDTFHSLLGWEPRAALVSFSTDGSAEHEKVAQIREAVRIANERRPDLKIDGEFQLDAAIVPKVAEKKVKRQSAVAGRANIVIFPDLNAGNIGVKLLQIFGKQNAYGPILVGFAKTVSDCSRSAPVSEIVGNIAITAAKSGGGE